MKIQCPKCGKKTENTKWEIVEDNPTGSGENFYRCPKCDKASLFEPAY